MVKEKSDLFHTLGHEFEEIEISLNSAKQFAECNIKLLFSV